MNYIDRKSIALERFFAKRSELLSHLDDFTEESLRETEAELFPLKRLMLAVIVRDSLRYLRDTYQLGEHIPESISASAGLTVRRFIKDGHFTEFLLWLRGVHLRNAQMRVPWETSLKTAASRLRAPADTFLRSFFALSNQRVFITLEGDEMTVTPAEREWGHAVIRFLDCRFDEQPPMPLPGFSVAAEADLSDRERIGLSLLIDTRFGEVSSDFSDRLLSDEGWQTVSFSCSDAILDAEFVDYAGIMRVCGASKAEIVFECCRILLNKRLLIGVDGLNPRERSMMPVAALLGAVDAYMVSMQGKKDQPALDFADWQYDDIILESLSNRCVMQNFIGTLKEFGCRDLAVVLEKAAMESYMEQNDKALSSAKMFGVGINKKIGDGTLRPLLHYLCIQLSEASALNTGATERTRAEMQLAGDISDQISPELHKLGFSGSFPDFRRSSDNRTDYLSFMLERRSERVNKGMVTYSVSVAAAQLDSEMLDRYAEYKLPREEITAIDSLAESIGISCCGELCDHHDGGPAMFDLDFYSDDDMLIAHEEVQKLKSYVFCADYQFKAGRLPLYYRRRMSADTALGAFGRAFGYCLPIAVVLIIALLAAYLLFGEEVLHQPFSRPAAVLIALGIGVAFNCIAGAVRCAICSKKLWRY